MNFKCFITFIVIFSFILAACSPSKQDTQGLEDTEAGVVTNTSTPEPTSTFTPEPTVPSTATPTHTPTITPTPTQAVISTTNLESLALVKSIGNKDTFSSFDSISLNQSGEMLAISGNINHQILSVIYDTNNFDILSTLPALNNLVFSSDERSVAGNNNGDIEIWDISSGETILEFEGSSHTIKELAWSSIKSEMAGVDTENTLLIWDSDTGKLIFSQQLPEPLYFSELKLEYSPSGNFLSIIGFDATVRIWDGERIHEIKGHADIVTHSSWSPDEQYLATNCEWEENAYVWRMDKYSKMFKFEHQYRADNIAWSPTGDIIATVENRGTIKLWNANTGKIKHSFTFSSNPSHIAWSPDGSKIAGLYYSDGFKVYDISTKQEFTPPEDYQKDNTWFLWIGDSILSVNTNNRMQIWNVQSNEIKMFINPDFGSPDTGALSPDGKTLAYAENGGLVFLIDVESEEILVNIQTDFTTYGIRDFAWSSDNQLLGISGNWSNKIIVVNTESGFIENTLEHDAFRQYTYLSWFNNTNKLIAGDRKILVWDIETSEITQVLEMHESSVMDLELSQDGKQLAAAGFRGEIYVWNTSDWSREYILQGSNEELILADLSFSPNGDKIASLGVGWETYYLPDSTRFQIWDCDSQEIIIEWYSSELLTNSIAFSPDGQVLATSSGSLWDHLTGELLFKAEYEGWSVHWTPDSKYVVFIEDLVDFWGVK